jgi:hypothetical protein
MTVFSFDVEVLSKVCPSIHKIISERDRDRDRDRRVGNEIKMLLRKHIDTMLAFFVKNVNV